MQKSGGIPVAGQMGIGRGIPLGAGVVDYLASNPEQRIWYVLRHEQDFTAAMTGGTVDFFNVVTSAARDGNVEKANSISEPQIFFVYNVSLRVEARATAADIALLLDSLYLSITINNRLELGPLNAAHFPASGGIATAATTVGSNGLASPQLGAWMPVPLVEKGGEFFRYRVDIGVTLAALAATRRVECAQWGVLFRRAVSQ